MKRLGFTMIELIFVIVILGILSAVALPRMFGVQNSALITAEAGGLTAVQTSLTIMNGNRITNGATDMNLNLVDTNGQPHAIVLDAVATVARAANSFSGGGFPWDLSVNADNTVQAAGGAVVGAIPLLLVTDKGDPAQWVTAAGTVNANQTTIQGPATLNVIDTDNSFKYDNAGQWGYDATTGTIVYDGNSSAF